MKTLILGGTLFLGRAVVDSALAAGHEVTLFNRGKTNPGLYPDVEHLVGDRDGDLSALEGRSFDLVIDPSGYFPRQVRTVVETLDAIGHYTFVSSCSVYADHSQLGNDESAAVETIDDPSVEELGPKYGGFKALSEQALDELLPGKVHHVRAGLIVGPHDNTGRFSYWVRRIADGGDVLAPEPQDMPVQVIDVRDIADWIIHAAASGVSGPVNASSAQGALTMRDLLEEIRAVTQSAANLTWVGEDFLTEKGVEPWMELPLWLPPNAMPTHAGFMSRDTSKAASLGMQIRPVSDTIDATFAFLQEGGAFTKEKDFGNKLDEPGLKPERERELLDEWAVLCHG